MTTPEIIKMIHDLKVLGLNDEEIRYFVKAAK
jgi:hypothetical protein